MSKIFLKDTLIIGFAIFAIFFGAGNLIFPPYLGWNSGINWIVGFIAFIVVDVGLSIFSLLVLAKIGKGPQGIPEKLGKKVSVVILSINVICLGPLIAIPRTAATTFELAIKPLLPNMNSWLFSLLFFAVIIILSIRQTKAVDVIGAVLAPIMFVILLYLIAKGIFNPIGVIEKQSDMGLVIKEGILAGYQTMDMMAAIVVSSAVIISASQKGYTTNKEKFKIISASGIVAAIALFIIYGGLAYLGATASSFYSENITQAELLTTIVWSLMGKGGIILLGAIVAVACLTTAIGLISASASFFEEVSDGKFKYKYTVIVFSLISYIISNFGISTIIFFAAPILDFIYPILLILTILCFFENKIRNPHICRLACIGSVITNICILMERWLKVDFISLNLPLNEYGFGWVIPSILFGCIGSLIKDKTSLKS